MSNKDLDQAQLEMKERQADGITSAAEQMKRTREQNKESQRARRARVSAEKSAAIEAEFVEDSTESAAKVLQRLKDALMNLDGLSPEQVKSKVTSITDVLRLKLSLQVSACLDRMESTNPKLRREALDMFETLMPFITQLKELDVKMEAVLGLGENKRGLLGNRGARQSLPAAPAASAEAWEQNFGDTLTNKTIANA